MKAALIQIQLGLNAQVLSGLYGEHRALKASRKMYNERADKLSVQVLGEENYVKADSLQQESDDNRAQAAVLTPYINKFARRIKAVEKVQKALKKELKLEQAIEMWQAYEDAEWLNLAKLAQMGGYGVTYSYDELAEMFKETE